MKETVFALMTLWFLAGCAETGGQKSPVKAKKQGFKGLPIELQVQDDEAIPVRIETKDKEGIPVRVQWQEDNGKPVKVEVKSDKALSVDVNLQGDKRLSVRLDMEGDKVFPVEIKLLKRAWIPPVIAACATIVIAIFTYCAAGSAKKSVKAAKLAAEGRLFVELMHEYASQEMRNDLRILFKWDGENKLRRDEEAEKWVKALFDEEGPQEDLDEIDSARRHVTHYFLHIWDLEESKYVRKGFAKRICEAVGTEVLNVVFPFEKALIQYIGKRDEMGAEEVEMIVEKLEKKFEDIKRLSSYARFRH